MRRAMAMLFVIVTAGALVFMAVNVGQVIDCAQRGGHPVRAVFQLKPLCFDDAGRLH